MAEQLPRRFGRYRLVERMGGAGMSAVYLALNTGHQDKRCVIKQLPEQLAVDDAFRVRFEQEIAIVAALESPHIVQTFDSGSIDGTLFLAMSYVGGGDVGDLIGRGALDPRDVADLVEQVGWALDAAHRHEPSIAHRDIKPANVLVCERPPGARLHTLVADFGIARPDAEESRITATGMAIGTFPYMAPERFGGMDETDDWCAVDVYALACVAYECLTGRAAFAASWPGIVTQHQQAPRPLVSEHRPEFHACDDVIAHGLAVHPGDRPSPTEFAAELSEALDKVVTPTGPPRGRPVVPRHPTGERLRGSTTTPPQPIPPPGADGVPVEPAAGARGGRRGTRIGAYVLSRSNAAGTAAMTAVALGGVALGAGLVPHLLATLAAYGVGAVGAGFVGGAVEDREGSRTAEGSIVEDPSRHPSEGFGA